MRIVSLGLALATMSCSSPPPVDAFRTSDSTGVILISNPAPGPETPIWNIDLDRPVAIIGGTDDPENDINIGLKGMFLPDGRILIPDNHEYHLRVFDQRGALVAKFGRTGDGPGEFRSMPTVALRGDSIVAIADQMSRLVVYDPRFTVARAESRRYVGATTVPLFLGLRPDGGILTLVQDLDGKRDIRSNGWYRIPYRLMILPRNNDTLMKLLDLPGDERDKDGLNVSYGKTTPVVVAKDKLYLGTNDSYRLDVMDLGGMLERSIRVHQNPTEIPQALKEQNKTLSPTSFGEVMPFYGMVLIGTDGSIWMSAPRASFMEGWRFTIFDSTGRLIATSALPERTFPLAFSKDRALVRRVDSNEVVRLELCRIVPTTNH